MGLECGWSRGRIADGVGKGWGGRGMAGFRWDGVG